MQKRHGKLEQARDYFQKVLTLSPNDGDVIGALGDVEKRSGNFEKADSLYEKALQVPEEMRGYKFEVIIYTAIADNLRRWSEELAKARKEKLAVSKARASYEYALKAVEDAGSDYRARATLTESAFQLGMLLSDAEGIDAALPFFQKSVYERPERIKEKIETAKRSYFIASRLLRAGKKQEADKYYRLGVKLPRDKQMSERYETLRAELYSQRYTGRLYNVFESKGYGFIERDDPHEQIVFAHIRDFIQKISNAEFKDLEGHHVSFTMERNEKGYQARSIKIEP